MPEIIDKITSVELHQLGYEELLDCLKPALLECFGEVELKIEQSPDFQSKPWGLAASGLGGNSCIADIGGVDNLHYPENNYRSFQLDEVARRVGLPESFVMGPAAGVPKHSGGVLSEVIANSNLVSGETKSKMCKVTQDGKYLMDDYRSNEIVCLANVLLCEGKPSQVLHIRVSQRKGDVGLPGCIRKALDAAFPKTMVGLAGVFQITLGNIKAHVMPDFSGTELLNKQQVDNWLRFYEMKAPLICTSILLNSDPSNLGFRLEHTHFYSDHGDCGHYHIDTTPTQVEYDAYFVICKTAFRVNPPILTPERQKNQFK